MIIFFAAKDGETLYCQQTQDLRLTVSQIMSSLLNKESRENTRPFRYDPNQIPYDLTVEVTNRFKGLYLTDRLPEEPWTEVPNAVQEAVTKSTPKKKISKNAKWLSEKT